MEREMKKVKRRTEKQSVFLLISVLIICFAFGNTGGTVYGAEFPSGSVDSDVKAVLQKPVRPANTAKSGVDILRSAPWKTFPYGERSTLSSMSPACTLLSMDTMKARFSAPNDPFAPISPTGAME